MNDLLIHSATLVHATGQQEGNLLIDQGKIVAILPPDERPVARTAWDAHGLVVLPGLIDTHVHLRDPGRPEREDFTTGTSAAAAGGVTTILEMPISEPPVNTGAILAERARLVQPRALVDFGLYGAVGAENYAEVPGMAAAGAIAFKTFLHAAPPGREHEFYGLCCTDDALLPEIMRTVAATGLRHAIHCENDAMLEHGIAHLRQAGRRDPLAHAESRPAIVEDAAVAQVLALAAHLPVALQIVHLSSPVGAAMVREAKARGINVTVETCPQYLFLDQSALEQHGPYAKCNPALRTSAEVVGMWQALRAGVIDVIGSDHSPYQADEKERGRADIFDCVAGVPGLETTLPLLLSAVHAEQISLPEVVRLTSTRAAEVFGLPHKGRIAVGADADLTLVDRAASWVFDHSRCQTKARACMRLWDGRQMHGQVVGTIVRGVTVYREGQIMAAPGHGQWLRPRAR
ncbi:MAG: allantoinase [Roseiflexaceae bacterium]